MLTEKIQREAARRFVADWTGRGYERGESQQFWLQLLTQVFGVDDPANFIRFEERVKLSNQSFIDAHIPATRVLIEQKSLGKDLRQGIPQSDGSVLTPYKQAKRYADNMPFSMRPRWIVVSNFASFLVYDLEQPGQEPEEILLENLEREFFRLSFLVNPGEAHLHKEEEVSVKAGEIIGRIYDALLVQYGADDPATLRALNMLCVRLVFCLYAEDAGHFGRDQFHDYLAAYNGDDLRTHLLELFRTLNTPEHLRSRYLAPQLAAFPYTNGGLFAEEVDIPPFTPELKTMLLKQASLDFDWSRISPTIFGAVFESTLNPLTRRAGGMHYTSVQNIHRLIDPLFLDALTDELDAILARPQGDRRARALADFQDKLASLRFLDPACGSGNFLTETYLSLRRLENRALEALFAGRRMMGELYNPIKVSINQFYGIEINDFAAVVATTALWISEAQMLAETERIVQQDISFLPLRAYNNICEGNALQTDWTSLCPKEELTYIIGNPPFVGYSLQSAGQKEDMLQILTDEKGKPYKMAGKVDYVAAWFFKAAQLMQGTSIRTAFVATNSITQGEQVAAVWQPVMERFGAHIDFAYPSFRWDNEASDKAHVHCVIVGFSCDPALAKAKRKKLFAQEGCKEVDNINAYLVAANNEFINNRKLPLCDVPLMTTGNRPADGGFLIIEQEDYDDFIAKEPDAVPFIKKFVGSTEFINNKKRYCLWLVDASPAQMRKMPLVMKRIEGCKQDRLNSPDKGRQQLADMPHLFREIQNPNNYLIIPKVSSERRPYIPIGYMDKETIASDLVFIIPSASLYHFGVLTSWVHMAWMRAVCGRLKSDYRYSKDVVYNNFPWPEADEAAVAAISETAQAILDARAAYPDSSLADLYDDTLMPPALRRAHRNNDRAVLRAYGFPTNDSFTESDCVARLFQLYADWGK